MAVTNPLRIHFFTNFVHQQGTYFRFHNLAVGLTRLGQQVTVFAADLDAGSKLREEVRDEVKYSIIPEAWKSSLFGSACHPVTMIRRYLRNYPPCDVAHLFQPFPSAFGAWDRATARTKFYDWDDLWSGGLWSDPPTLLRDNWSRFLVNRLEQRLPQRADHVTAINRFLAGLATARGAKQTTIIPSGSWPFVIPDKAAARTSLGLKPEALYVGFMGRTAAELSWCFEAVEQNLSHYENLRFALCGPPAELLENLPTPLRERIDFLGNLPPQAARDFAAALDLGLLPLEDNAFNQSRMPQKYFDYLAAGSPLLCSDVGECAYISNGLPWVVTAGKTKAQWLESFARALDLIRTGQLPKVDLDKTDLLWSWEAISQKLLDTYKVTLNAPKN